mmetsp:Transcript_28837/g.49088  ORF Transcript_28837/g.49088 Transcript_28837/m.49088 type:complete len:124 (+) Transcript_28837:559-930(+)
MYTPSPLTPRRHSSRTSSSTCFMLYLQLNKTSHALPAFERRSHGSLVRWDRMGWWRILRRRVVVVVVVVGGCDDMLSDDFDAAATSFLSVETYDAMSASVAAISEEGIIRTVAALLETEAASI